MSFDSTSFSNLIEVIENRQWCGIDEHIAGTNGVDQNGRTALHKACFHNAPTQTIELLYRSNPEAALMRDNNGWTPLHRSVVYSSEDKVIQFLTKVAPAATSKVDNFGDTPLHDALLHRRSYGIIRALIDANPYDVNKSNLKGDTPLDTFLALWYSAIKSFVEKLPESLPPSKIMEMEIVRGGQLYSVRYVYNMTCLIFNHAMRTSGKADNPKAKLLHSVLKMESCPWVFYEFLMRIHPDQIHDKADCGNLPITLMAQHSNKSIYNKIFKCWQCKHSSSVFYAMHGTYFCTTCMAKMAWIGGHKYSVIRRNDELEKVQTIYQLLRETPYLTCSIAQ